MQIRSVYFCIETCIGENINWKSYNRIIKLFNKLYHCEIHTWWTCPRTLSSSRCRRSRHLVSSLKCQKAREISQVIERLARNSGWDDTRPIFCLLLLFWFFFDSWQDEVLNIAKIGLLNRTFNSKGQVLCLLRKMWHHVDVDHDRRNIWNLTRVEMIIRRKVVYIFVLWKNIDHSVRNTKNQRGENR